MRTVGTIVLVMLVGAGLSAQEAPALTEDQQLVVTLNNEIERLANDLQQALNDLATLQTRVNVLSRAYNTLRLSSLRTESTPKAEGWIFDWQIDPQTGRRLGFARVVVTVDDPD